MNNISRRTLIGSAGVALALPLLELMAPAQAPLARAVTTPKSRSADVVVPRTRYRLVHISKSLLFEDDRGRFRHAIRGDEVLMYAHAYFGWGLRPDKAHLSETICRYRGLDAVIMTEEIMTSIRDSGEAR